MSPHFLRKWQKLLGFPKPIAAINRSVFYRIADLDAWDRQWAGLTRDEITRKAQAEIEQRNRSAAEPVEAAR